MKLRRKYIPFLMLFLTLIQIFTQSSVPPVSAAGLPLATEIPKINYESVADAVNATALRAHIKYLSSLGSRLTGYPGCNQAAEYIYDYFSQIGLSGVEYHEYNISDVA